MNKLLNNPRKDSFFIRSPRPSYVSLWGPSSLYDAYWETKALKSDSFYFLLNVYLTSPGNEPWKSQALKNTVKIQFT